LLSDGIFARPELMGHILVDDYNAFRSDPVTG
jgi:hypothetical protein